MKGNGRGRTGKAWPFRHGSRGPESLTLQPPWPDFRLGSYSGQKPFGKRKKFFTEVMADAGARNGWGIRMGKEKRTDEV